MSTFIQGLDTVAGKTRLASVYLRDSKIQRVEPWFQWSEVSHKRAQKSARTQTTDDTDYTDGILNRSKRRERRGVAESGGQRTEGRGQWSVVSRQMAGLT